MTRSTTPGFMIAPTSHKDDALGTGCDRRLRTCEFGFCDTLLRFATLPMLDELRWSSKIIDEAARTLRHELGWPVDLVEYFESDLGAHFPEA